ncbi:MAG: hypothetical protein U9P37_01745 [Pseudomonadota bacterium]|nr:hypothetical protein [Pseudomonadota bacterium]
MLINCRVKVLEVTPFLPLKSAGHQAEQRFMVNKNIVVQFELFIDFKLQLKKAGLPFFRQPGY